MMSGKIGGIGCSQTGQEQEQFSQGGFIASKHNSSFGNLLESGEKNRRAAPGRQRHRPGRQNKRLRQSNRPGKTENHQNEQQFGQAMKHLAVSKKGDRALVAGGIRILVHQPVERRVGGQKQQTQQQAETNARRRDFSRTKKSETLSLLLQIMDNKT
jgi:hypothetical protein